MTKVNDLHRSGCQRYRPRTRNSPPNTPARAVIEARTAAGLTQEQLAERMATTQSVIARLEGGRARPSTQTLKRLALATGTRLKISFEPTPTR
ncbi:MAG: helix-turn-helix transcriptional regulator [Bryobacterales bacterium]|nr:helix-turn-helix transcriptional regulator [Bryobacterales bacterium]